jgi:osmotically-inducible protein OsmY
VVNVASGSVILSGTVENVDAAREIVEQVKNIPGVQQITFELGLIEKAG